LSPPRIPVFFPEEQSPQADFDSPIPSLLRGAQRTKGARAESRKRSSYLRAAHPAERFVS
jgi:hypothetical protein